MKEEIQNPFIIKGYISPEYFCDREKETEQLIANIRNGRNTALISERRMGKTGLIEHVYHQREVADNYYTFLIDIYSVGTLREFVFLLGKHIFETLKPRGQKFIDGFVATIGSLRPAIKFDKVTGAPSFDIGLGDIRQPELSLEQIFKYLEGANKRCIVAIDEFQQVARFAEKDVEALLRTHIQHCKNTDFIFAGSIHHVMSDIFFKASRPFYQSVSPMVLGSIKEEKYAAFVIKFFKAVNVAITEREVGFVYKLMEGRTWYMHCIFNELYAMASIGGHIDKFSIIRALESVVKSYEPIYQGLVANLTERQKEILFAIAKEDKVKEITSAEFIRNHGLQSASSVQSSVKQLIAKDIVVKTPEGYFIPDRFFSIWLRITYGSGLYFSELSATLTHI